MTTSADARSLSAVTVHYNSLDDYWGAESPQVPELVAGDTSLGDLTELVHSVLRDFTGNAELEIVDVVEGLATAQLAGE